MSDAESAAPRKTDRAEDRIGTVVDKFTIVRLLGRGGMGAVYEARHAKLARRFAIKFLLPEFAANRDVLRRFENEAKAAGGLEHPNLAGVMDVGQAEDGAPYLVMEFLQGQDGAKLLRDHGTLTVRRAADIVVQACRGLAVAHRAGIVHRDLKPENLFITDAGDGRDLVKVLDFGIAKLRTTDASVATGTGATFGTAFYMSPEQARGAGEVDHRSDVWSLGVLLYELLSGRKPFEGGAFLEVIHKILSTEPTPLGQLRAELPPALTAIVHQTMRRELLERVPSVVALAEALTPFASGAPSVSPSGLAATAPSAPTMATPATLPPRAASVAPAPTAAPVNAPPPLASARHGTRVAVIVAVVVAGALAVVLGGVLRSAPPAVAPPVERSAQGPAPKPEPAPVVTPTPPPVVPPAPGLTPTAAKPARPEPAVSGQRERRSNAVRTRIVVVGGDHPDRAEAPSPPPPAAPKPAPAAEPRRGSQSIDIEKDNPYGN